MRLWLWRASRATLGARSIFATGFTKVPHSSTREGGGALGGAFWRARGASERRLKKKESANEAFTKRHGSGTLAVGATRIEGFPIVAASPAFRRVVSATIFFEKIKRTSSNFLQRSDAEVVH